jgi:hypothetical protein
MDDIVGQRPGQDGPEWGVGRSGNARRWRLTGVGLPRSLDEFRFREVAVAIVVALTIWGYVDIEPHGRIRTDHLDWHKTDFTVYTEAASAFFDGRDPYRVMNPRGWYYLYPPLFALTVAPLTVFDSGTQVIAWYVVSIVLAFGCYFEARALWRLLAAGVDASRRGRFSLVVGIGAFAAVLLPALDCLQRGQVGVMLLYFLMLGFRLVLQSRGPRGWLAGGVILALPAVLKLVPILPVGFLLGQIWIALLAPGERRTRAIRAGAVTAGVVLGGLLFLIVIPAAIVGWQKNLDYLHTWTVQIASNQLVGRRSNFDIHSPRNQSLTNAVFLWCDPDRSVLGRPLLPELLLWARGSVQGIRGVILLILAGFCLASGRRNRPLDLALGYALACAATLLISPIAWGHYYLIELPALLVVPLWLAGKGRHVAAWLFLAVPTVLVWPHYIWLKHLSWTGLLGLGTTAWFLAFCGLIALSWDERPDAASSNSIRARKNRARRRRPESEPRSVFS